jgi:hypothetical protein
MAITRRPAAEAPRATADEFISRAPDAVRTSEPTAATRPRKETISLGIDPVLLQKIDVFARCAGISRAAAIALAMSKLVGRDE